MSKKYEKKKLTGREHVSATKEFVSYTVSRCMQLPEEWKDYLLAPLVSDAEEIERLVLEANRVYINEKNQDMAALIAAYEDRDRYLTESLRLFNDFDIKFDRLMSYIDVSGAEIYRLKDEILNLLRQEQKGDSEVKVKIIAHKDCMEYRAANGSVFESLRLNSRNKDQWLSLRKESEDWISKRLSWDRNALKKLRNLKDPV